MVLPRAVTRACQPIIMFVRCCWRCIKPPVVAYRELYCTEPSAALVHVLCWQETRLGVPCAAHLQSVTLPVLRSRCACALPRVCTVAEYNSVPVTHVVPNMYASGPVNPARLLCILALA